MPMRFDHLLQLAERPELPEPIRGLRRDGLRALAAALHSVLPEVLLPDKVQLDDDALAVVDLTVPRAAFSRIVVVGGGKATAGMCRSLVERLDERTPFTGAINIPYGQPVPGKITAPGRRGAVDVTFCRHPIPDEAGVAGVERMRRTIAASPADALVLALISGGGSALMPLPAEGITIEDKMAVNRLLLSCGASIQEINCVRKHLSRIKGGGLSATAHPRRVFSLIISDVVGDDLQTIASGPTVPDATTYAEAVDIVRRHGILHRLPERVRRRLAAGLAGRVPETPKPGDPIFAGTVNRIIGSARTAAAVARQGLAERGYQAGIFTTELHGEARRYGAQLAHRLPGLRTGGSRLAAIGTGEFTVTLRGSGRGGRNQEMLLGLLNTLQKNPDLETHRLSWVVISAAFDGIEGNSEAMGALIDSTSLKRLQGLNIDLRSHLERNDAKTVFEALGDLLVTGQTGTNVNDMTLILVDG
jgi:glycerate-2-kinase